MKKAIRCILYVRSKEPSMNGDWHFRSECFYGSKWDASKSDRDRDWKSEDDRKFNKQL